MSKQWVASFAPGDSKPSGPVYNAAGLETVTNQVSLYIGDNVPTYRQSEIVNAWQFLLNGIWERNLIGQGRQFEGALLYTAVDINAITTRNRRTDSGPLTNYTDTDVILGMGPTVTGRPGGETVMLAEVTRNLIDFAIQSREIG